MTDADRFVIATRLFAALKRHGGRVIDVLWLLENESYAQEVLRLAANGDADCVELGQRLAPLLLPAASSRVPVANHAAPTHHYLRGLR